MIFFGWDKIRRKAGTSSKRILLAFRAHVSTNLPKNKYDPLYNYYYTDFSGTSFMLDPQTLLRNAFRYSAKELAQYIALCSFRSYGYYKVTGDASLDLFHSPVDEDTINKNRLLKVKNGRVHFYYEEVTNRRNKLWH